jgi:hypothetical protein
VGGAGWAGRPPEGGAHVVGVDPGLERLAQGGVRARPRRRLGGGQVPQQPVNVPAVDHRQPPLLGGEPGQQLVEVGGGGGQRLGRWPGLGGRIGLRGRAGRLPVAGGVGAGRGQDGVPQPLGRDQLLAGAEPGGGAAQLVGLGPAGGAGGQVGLDLGGLPRLERAGGVRAERGRDPDVRLLHQPRPPFRCAAPRS